MAPFYDSGVRWDDPRLRYDDPRPYPITMSETRNTFPVNEVLGFMDTTRQMLETNKTAMTALGVDPTTVITGLGTGHTDLTTKNGDQEGLKTQLRIATEAAEGSKATGYTLASRGCDMLISAFGRTSLQAKEATALRKALRRSSREEEEPTPPTP